MSMVIVMMTHLLVPNARVGVDSLEVSRNCAETLRPAQALEMASERLCQFYAEYTFADLECPECFLRPYI